MNKMNEKGAKLRLSEYMGGSEGWGRPFGREVFPKLLRAVEEHAGTTIFRVSLEGVKRIDISFADETVIGLAKRFRGDKGFCFVDVSGDDVLENWEAAAIRREQPLMVWRGMRGQVIGPQPSQGNVATLEFALKHEEVTAAELALRLKLQINNASTKLKQLYEQGYLLRRQTVAVSGGIEFIYYRIG